MIGGCGRCQAGVACSSAGGGEPAGGEMVGLDRADDRPLGHLVEVTAVARVGRGELAGRRGRRAAGRRRAARARAAAASCRRACGRRWRRSPPRAARRARPAPAAARAATAGAGASWRSAFITRTMPLPWPAEPISASITRFSREDAGADGVDLVARRLAVLDQLLEQVVVELGEMLEQLAARLVLAVERAGGDLDQLRRLALAVGPGALGDEVDRAGDLAALADRDLAQHDRVLGVVLQRRDDVARRGRSPRRCG